MNHLSLFTGAGGGELAFKYLIPEIKRTVGYVEFENYCQKVIRQRIKDGLLDAAPIFGDIRKFISEGYAEAYKGMVDVISAGFPCQEFSVAGKRKADKGSRNMWPGTIEVIRIVKPEIVYLENVPGLLSASSEVDGITKRSVPYYGTILRELAEAGYNAKWTCLSAQAIGARHKRNRLWIYASLANA